MPSAATLDTQKKESIDLSISVHYMIKFRLANAMFVVARVIKIKWNGLEIELVDSVSENVV